MGLLGKIKRAIHNLIYVDFFIEREGQRLVENQKQISAVIKYYQLKQRYETLAFQSASSGVTDVRYDDRELVVSLTTHSKRIHTIFSTIESLFQQTWKANRIVLYVSEDHFTDETLPETLKMQMKRGLEVRYVKDVRSYTKLVYALEDFPEANIITVDDDYWYPHDFFERMIKTHLESPEAICANEVRLMTRDKSGAFTDFNQFPRIWNSEGEQPDKEKYYLIEGYAGLLYPPHSLYKDVCDSGLFLKLAPTNDDLWFKVMALLQGTRIKVVNGYTEIIDYITVQDEVQDIGLFNINQSGAFNKQLDNLIQYYKLDSKW